MFVKYASTRVLHWSYCIGVLASLVEGENRKQVLELVARPFYAVSRPAYTTIIPYTYKRLFSRINAAVVKEDQLLITINI